LGFVGANIQTTQLLKTNINYETFKTFGIVINAVYLFRRKNMKSRLIITFVLAVVVCSCSVKISTYREQYIDSKCEVPIEQLFNQLSEFFIVNGFDITSIDYNRGFLETQGRYYLGNVPTYLMRSRGVTVRVSTDPNFIAEGDIERPKWSILVAHNKKKDSCYLPKSNRHIFL